MLHLAREGSAVVCVVDKTVQDFLGKSSELSRSKGINDLPGNVCYGKHLQRTVLWNDPTGKLAFQLDCFLPPTMVSSSVKLLRKAFRKLEGSYINRYGDNSRINVNGLPNLIGVAVIGGFQRTVPGRVRKLI